jgi:hypothetical protein
MGVTYTHGRLLTALLAVSSFALALYLFKHSETKYSIVSWLDVSRKDASSSPSPSPPNADESENPDQPSFNQRKADREHLERLTERASERLGGLAAPSDPSESPSFTANEQWQEVPDGQYLEPGVQYRVNQSTGKMEARLEPKPTTSSSEPSQIEAPTDLNRPMKPTQPLMTTPIEQPNLSNDKDEKEESMSRTEKSMTDLLRRYRQSAAVGVKLGVLQMLQYDLRDQDAAEVFIDMKGHLMLKADLNNTDKFVRSMITLVFGTLASNSPHLKGDLLQDDCLEAILNMLRNNSEYIVWLPSVFAINQLIRRHPDGQKRFVKENGAAVLLPVFAQTDDDSQKLQLKIVNMLSSLREDNISLKMTLSKMAEQKISMQAPMALILARRLDSYNEVALGAQIKADQYCEQVPAHYRSMNLTLKIRVVHWLAMYREECSDKISAFQEQLKALQSVVKNELKDETDQTKEADWNESLDDIETLTQAN